MSLSHPVISCPLILNLCSIQRLKHQVKSLASKRLHSRPKARYSHVFIQSIFRLDSSINISARPFLRPSSVTGHYLQVQTVHSCLHHPAIYNPSHHSTRHLSLGNCSHQVLRYGVRHLPPPARRPAPAVPLRRGCPQQDLRGPHEAPAADAR